MQLLYRTVLFDFDGTLCASGQGIMECVALALREMGRAVPPPDTLRRFIGPPAEQSYQMYCGMSPAQADEAVRHFRAHYDSNGWLHSEPYPGIAQLLRDLRAAGAKVATASSKPQPMVERLLRHLEIDRYFTAFCAADADGGRADKPSLIRRAMLLCGERELAQTVMIGDTRFDAQGALEVGVPFVGAAYGYGGEEDLRVGGATRIAATPDGLRTFLFRE